MISKKNFFKLYVVLGFLSWIILTIIDLTMLVGEESGINFGIPNSFNDLFFAVLCVCIFLIFKLEIGSRGEEGFTELLWKSFVTCSVALLVLLLVKLFYSFIENTNLAENNIVINFFYHINAVFLLIMLATSFFLFKRMILFQKNKVLAKLWLVFEVLMCFCILSSFLDLAFTDKLFLILFFPILAYSIYISINLKWIAYLTFKQKWRSIILLTLILAICIAFLQYLYDKSVNNNLILDVTGNLFVVTVFSFTIIYCIISVLVLLFNLPTSSVFEKKFNEVLNFQRLSQIVQIGQEESQVYDVLFEGSFGTVQAVGGWLEVFDDKGNISAFLSKNIEKDIAIKIKTFFRKNDLDISNQTNYIKDITSLKYFEEIKKLNYKSFLIMPLQTYNKKLGLLTLISDVKEGFDNEVTNIVETYVSQASVTIHNARLISNAIENERYKEALKIAEKVQQSLLPKELINNKYFETAAFCKSAEEVGGDYYDVFEISSTKFALIIGDVSGKGTSAAFHMAQMKGVFQALIQMDLSPQEFMTYANQALSSCLEKTTFITLTLLMIDVEEKTIVQARAGHCPMLYYNKILNKSNFVTNKGLGLGIVRNNSYKNFISNDLIKYSSGDSFVLYTDGIVEAKRTDNEEFGDERLQLCLETHSHLSASNLIDVVMKDVYNFVGNEQMNDDCTLLVLKFV